MIAALPYVVIAVLVIVVAALLARERRTSEAGETSLPENTASTTRAMGSSRSSPTAFSILVIFCGFGIQWVEPIWLGNSQVPARIWQFSGSDACAGRLIRSYAPRSLCLFHTQQIPRWRAGVFYG